MSKITRFERFENNDGLEFVVDKVSGKAYAAGIRSVARMLKAPESTIRNKIGAQNYSVVMAEIQTNSGVQGARLIPADVVFELAIEYNPDLAKAMGTAGANLYMLGLAGYTIDINSKPSAKDDIDLACFALDNIFGNILNPALLAGLKLNAIQELAPSVATTLEPTRQILINATAQQHQLLTPSEIGKRLGISGQKVNQLLIEKGLQVKSDRKSKKDPAYVPTDRGHEFADLTLTSGKSGDSTTYQQLRWYESVINFLV